MILRNIFNANLLVGLLTTSACVSPPKKELNDNDIGRKEPLEWDDLSDDDYSLEAPPSVVTTAYVAPPRAPTQTLRYHPRITHLPFDLQREPRLAQLAVARMIHQPVMFDKGVYGKVGSAVFFISHTDKINSYDRLYWVMVAVLSEKYGCFMREKFRLGNELRFRCRDGRKIVFWRSRGNDWIQFYGRQYDRFGRELVVHKHRVIN